ncbi:MAG TPA: FHA domain-containing protein [Verrucomicrobiae bacterium]|nr:FHA domain-containing protein [Verrucomicrobiae bacterium]
MPKVIIHCGAEPAHEFQLKTGVNSVGRGDANDLQIHDPSVSTRHAEIIVDGSGVSIKDLGSTNGTFINQAPVTETALCAGQSLRLGSVELIFEEDVPVAIATAALVSPMAASPVALPTAQVQTALPAAAPAVAPAPAGKTACKFHPRTAGEWLCRKCNGLFCSACVNIKRTSEGASTLCRKCGTPCVPVKVKFVAPREKTMKAYSDGAILLRCLVFGFGGAVLSALLWTGLSWLFGFDILFIFIPMVAVICGYAVKLASQDRPGPVFSGIAVGYFLFGSVLGKAGMLAVTHLQIYTGTVLLTGVLGLALGFYAAWKIGGGE